MKPALTYVHTRARGCAALRLSAGASEITRVNEGACAVRVRTYTRRRRATRVAGGLNEPRVHTGFSLARLFAKRPSCLRE